MENKKYAGGTASSSSSSSFDHLFGPRGSSASSPSSSTTGSFSSMFQHPQPPHQAARYGNPEHGSRGLANQETAEPSYLSSSIYYGGQENYSPRKRNTETHHNFKKDGKDDPNESSSSGASRGNWWEGSLYY